MNMGDVKGNGQDGDESHRSVDGGG